MNPEFPEDLITDILWRLPIGQWIGRFRCVCRSWLALFSDPSFILREKSVDSGLQILINSINDDDDRSVYSLLSADKLEPLLPSPVQLPFNAEKPLGDNFRYSNRAIRIAGSCNGLICIKDRDYDLILWNPATSETKLVRPSPLRPYWFLQTVGFGFDSETEDYKIVRQSEDDNGSWGCRYFSEVYSLRDDSWTKLADDDENGYYLRASCCQMPQCHKGKLYWWLWTTNPAGQPKSLEFESFAISSHEFRTVDLRFPSEIGVCGGDLEFLLNEEYMVALFPVKDAARVNTYTAPSWEIWVLLKYWVSESWTKLFAIVNPSPEKRVWRFSGISGNLKWLFLTFRTRDCCGVNDMPLHAISPEAGYSTGLHDLDIQTSDWLVIVVNFYAFSNQYT